MGQNFALEKPQAGKVIMRIRYDDRTPDYLQSYEYRFHNAFMGIEGWSSSCFSFREHFSNLGEVRDDRSSRNGRFYRMGSLYVHSSGALANTGFLRFEIGEYVGADITADPDTIDELVEEFVDKFSGKTTFSNAFRKNLVVKKVW